MTALLSTPTIKTGLSQEELDTLILKNDERRSSSRFPFMVPLRIAPKSNDERPRPKYFHVVACRDISEGGISFFMSLVPYFEELEIELMLQGASVSFTAQVVGSSPAPGLEPYHLVRCRFTGRTSPSADTSP